MITKKGENKMFKKLCSIIATIAIFVMALTPVIAADGTSAFPRYVNTFDNNTIVGDANVQ